MKKKEYMIPQSQVVMLQSYGNLLTVSGQGDTNNRTVTTEGDYTGDGTDTF